MSGERFEQPSEEILGAEEAHNFQQLREVLAREIVNGAEDELRNGHIDWIELTDIKGNVSRHTIDRIEAEDVDRALWSAGELMTVEALTERVVRQARADGLELGNPETLDIKIVLKSGREDHA